MAEQGYYGTEGTPWELWSDFWRFTPLTSDPGSTIEGDRWLRTDLDSGDKIATLRFDHGSGVWDIPVFPTSQDPSSADIKKVLRLDTPNGLGWVPVLENGGVFNQLGFQHGGARHGWHNALTEIPASAIAQYDAQALTGLSDQDTISSWPDEIGSFDLTDGAGFTYETNGINGNPSALADGDDDNLGRDSWGSSESQPNTIITVTELVSSTGNYIYAFLRSEGGETHQYVVNSSDNYRAYAGTTLEDGSVSTSPTISTVVYNGTSSEIRINGSQEASGDVGSRGIPNNTMRFGSAPGGGSQHTNIYFGEMVIYNDALTSEEISSEESRLADKWGITI